MVERDLRALDMRHTLPNLKNLLLTLSHSVETKCAWLTLTVATQRWRWLSNCSVAPHLDSPASSSSVSGIETPEAEIPTPKASRLDHCTTPIASGSTTPTAAALTDESRKAKPFLGLVNVPFAEFLRGRYPSSNQASLEKASSSLRDDDVDLEDGEEEDRKTINGISEEGSKPLIVDLWLLCIYIVGRWKVSSRNYN